MASRFPYKASARSAPVGLSEANATVISVERMIRRLDGIQDELLRLNAAIDRSRKQKES
ncbi:MAG: hypothetical protein IID36_06810 [Planctomycetes bacterium]|nr:hypothetical protein [Planctomycetota bacterium]